METISYNWQFRKERMRPKMKSSFAGIRKVSLALQGGGAHGAFTWGVLDRLLEEESIEICAISGSSAGALNGAALATGLARDGRDGAKAYLAQLWTGVAQAGVLITILMSPLRKLGGGVWDDLLPVLSPSQINPAGMEPLRQILISIIDEQILLRAEGPRLYVNALQVETGRERIFGPGDLSIDAVLASACVPDAYQPIEIEGYHYWDGSYATNPSLSPLYDSCKDVDIILVELTPQQRYEVPNSAKNIWNRINEVASIRGLASEFKALDLVNRSASEVDIRIHVVSMAEANASSLATEPSTKRTVDLFLFQQLREQGRRVCEAWLVENLSHLGERSSVDINLRYLNNATAQKIDDDLADSHI